jgi:effector-binding domain-containing protein
LAEWIVRNGGTPASSPWEVYFTDPAEEPDPQKWRTEIVMPFHVADTVG